MSTLSDELAELKAYAEKRKAQISTEFHHVIDGFVGFIEGEKTQIESEIAHLVANGYEVKKTAPATPA